MTQEEVQTAIKDGKAQFVKQPDQAAKEPLTSNDLAKFISVLDALRRPKYELATTPAFTPKTLLDQIQFYENGTTRRMYFYINGSWRYVTLT